MNKRFIASTTTLQPLKNESRKFIKVTFNKKWENSIRNLYRKYNLVPSFVNDLNIRNLLHSKIETSDPLKHSGIYKIECGNNNCNMLYIGQTKRNALKRASEHLYHLKYHHTEKSALAYHFENTGHRFSLENVTLVKRTSCKNLNMWESIFMKKYKYNLMNTDLSLLNNNLLKFIPTLNSH